MKKAKFKDQTTITLLLDLHEKNPIILNDFLLADDENSNILSEFQTDQDYYEFYLDSCEEGEEPLSFEEYCENILHNDKSFVERERKNNSK